MCYAPSACPALLPLCYTSASDRALAANVSSWADIVVLVVGLGNLIEVEGRDRAYLSLPPAQQTLLDTVSASVNPSTIFVIVIVSAGGVDISSTRADAILQAFYPGV